MLHKKTSEDVIVSRVGRALYEKFFRNYTRKQWGLDFSELDASVAARIPVRTVDRVGDAHFDQLELTGHQDRHGDLERLAWLGIKALRYPVLWERMTATGPGEVSWDWTDTRLNRIREIGLRPIVGLVHHGSGPKVTNLLDSNFATGLAAHAALVARRYSWVEEWTPVNEPGTTARFAALYGHWYPHAPSTRAFLRALINECRGTVLAMRESRRTKCVSEHASSKPRISDAP